MRGVTAPHIVTYTRYRGLMMAMRDGVKTMIVIVRAISEFRLENKLSYWMIAAKVLDAPTPSQNEWRLEAPESYRSQVRAWFAQDDDVLWFSKPEGGK